MHAIEMAIAPDLLATFTKLMERYRKTGERFGKLNFKQPFYEGERIADLGFLWENKVFLYFTEWPSWFQRDKKAYPERAPPRICADNSVASKMKPTTTNQYLVSTYYMRGDSRLGYSWRKRRPFLEEMLPRFPFHGEVAQAERGGEARYQWRWMWSAKSVEEFRNADGTTTATDLACGEDIDDARQAGKASQVVSGRIRGMTGARLVL